MPEDDAGQIAPTQIEHSVDRDWNGKAFVRSYNYLEYHFEQEGAYIRARAYLPKLNQVTVYGPFRGREDYETVTAFELMDGAMTYLQRRYREVSRR